MELGASANLDGLMAAANRAHAEGRLDDCARLCQAILGRDGKCVPAIVLLGIVAAKKGHPDAGAQMFQAAIRVDPQCGPAHLWLSMVLRRLGKKPEALNSARDAQRISPNDSFSNHQVGQCLIDMERFDEGEPYLRRALEITPNEALVHYNLGLALQGLKRNREAISALKASARLDPSSTATWFALRQIQMDENDSAGAVESARAALKLQPDSAEANLWLARALHEDQKGAEAELYMQRSIELDPSSSLAHSLLGSSLQMKGRIQDAEEHFRKSIELEPHQGPAYWLFATNRKMTHEDAPIIEQMRQAAGDTSLSPSSQSHLHYGLGKALEDISDYAAAMTHYDEANRISYSMKFGRTPFDRKSFERGCDQVVRTYSREFIERYNTGASSSGLPIFVVGMMRSGTTLSEQILSSHPRVGAAGEQQFWAENRKTPFTGASSELDLETLKMLAERYEAILTGIAPGVDHVVDKMPMNYEMIGLIHLAFPNAKIIHTRRDPIDTCLSIYATANRVRIPWAHDKASIAVAYRQYQRLMDHWRSVLPPGTMLEVEYEEMVSEPERITRSMIEFCGLEWDDACLRPQDNERSVVTPSVWQVRQPIYKTAVNRGKKFEPWLGPLASLK